VCSQVCFEGGKVGICVGFHGRNAGICSVDGDVVGVLCNEEVGV